MKENKPLKEEEKILHYLNDNLSEDDLKKIEAELDSDEFTKDALEGLVQLNQNSLPTTLHQINTDLKKQLRKRHKKIHEDYYTFMDLYYVYHFNYCGNCYLFHYKNVEINSSIAKKIMLLF